MLDKARGFVQWDHGIQFHDTRSGHGMWATYYEIRAFRFLIVLSKGARIPLSPRCHPRWDDVSLFSLFFSSFFLRIFFGKRFKIIVGLFREGNGTGVTDAPRSIHFYPLLRIAWHGSKALKTEPMACVARYILARAFNIPSWFSFDSNAFGAVFREFFLTIGVKYHLFDRLSIVSVFFFASCVFCKFLYIRVLHKYPQSNDRLTR